MKRLPLCMALFVMIFGFCVNGFSAPPGWVDLKKKSQPLPTTVSPTAQPGGITAAPVSSGGQPPFPTILAVLPNTLTQGQSGSLMISGRDLHKDMRIKLGEGITTGSTTLLTETGTNAMVPVSVAADASAGVRLVQVAFRDRTSAQPDQGHCCGCRRPACRRKFHQGRSSPKGLSGLCQTAREPFPCSGFPRILSGLPEVGALKKRPMERPRL